MPCSVMLLFLSELSPTLTWIKNRMNSYLQEQMKGTGWIWGGGVPDCSPVASSLISRNKVFGCIYSFRWCSLKYFCGLLSVFPPKFYCGILGTRPISVTENLFMEPSFSTAYQQLNTVFCAVHPNVSIYNINKLFLSSSQHYGGVYICGGYLSNSSQWAFTSGYTLGRERPQLKTGIESVLGKIPSIQI